MVGYAATTYHHQPLLDSPLQGFVSGNPTSDATLGTSSDTATTTAVDNPEADGYPVGSKVDHSEEVTPNDLKTAAVPNHVGSTSAPVRRLPVIGFDMGGTSTDVSRYDGSYEHVFESTTAGVTVQAPQVGIARGKKISSLVKIFVG